MAPSSCRTSVPLGCLLVTRDERVVSSEAVCSLGPLQAQGWSLACWTHAEADPWGGVEAGAGKRGAKL